MILRQMMNETEKEILKMCEAIPFAKQCPHTQAVEGV